LPAVVELPEVELPGGAWSPASAAGSEVDECAAFELLLLLLLLLLPPPLPLAPPPP
jgi:hypothetical protein